MSEPKRLTPEELAGALEWSTPKGLVDKARGHIAALEAELAEKNKKAIHYTALAEKYATAIFSVGGEISNGPDGREVEFPRIAELEAELERTNAALREAPHSAECAFYKCAACNDYADNCELARCWKSRHAPAIAAAQGDRNG